MYKIIFIDGGEGGRRVERLTNAIRQDITKEQLVIHRSNSRLNENREYHSLKGYDIAFIHNSDNVNEKLEPVFTIDAKNNNIPLVLYSGGIRGFNITDNGTCEINDTLLENKITQFLNYQLRHNFDSIDFNYLFPGENFIRLEELFRLKISIISNFENNIPNKAVVDLEMFASIIEKSGINMGKNYLNEITSASMMDIFNLTAFLNKALLKFEKKINPKL